MRFVSKQMRPALSGMAGINEVLLQVASRTTHRKSIPIVQFRNRSDQVVTPAAERSAVRTAFVARFIVLREGRRSRAHRLIETMTWNDECSAEDLYSKFRQAFIDNGDKLQPVDRDLRRALEHARCSVGHFMNQYVGRSTTSFAEALDDYERSNRLLFGDEEDSVPRSGGWKVPSRAGEGAESQQET